MYLNSVEGGGETEFPRAIKNAKTDGGGKEAGEAEEGIRVVPKPGRAVLFYNLDEDNNPDPHAVHSALPVTRGEKFLCNMWLGSSV